MGCGAARRHAHAPWLTQLTLTHACPAFGGGLVRTQNAELRSPSPNQCNTMSSSDVEFAYYLCLSCVFIDCMGAIVSG